MIAHVALPLPIDELFSYRIPPEAPPLSSGMRVLVPFGRRKLTGMVVETLEGDESGLKDIADVLDEEPSCSPLILDLTRWMAEYYACSWGEALRAALPSGIDVESRRVVSLVRDFAEAAPPGPVGSPSVPAWPEGATARALFDELTERGPTPISTLRTAVPKLTLTALRKLEEASLVRIDEVIREARVSVKTEAWVRLAEPWADPARHDEARASLRGARQEALLDALLAAPDRPRPRTALLSETGASTATLRSLEERGFIAQEEREVIRIPEEEPVDPTSPAITLHEGQRRADAAISSAVASGDFQTFLLHGITGSGKTEVYIAALKQVLEAGRTAIVLVPEIALTPQTVRRFRAHFGDAIAVLHSRMSGGERFDAWRSLRSGTFSVVIGPRSAILAPLENVGLIVVDEEHEPSYKQFDPAPRYHARDVAVMRARMAGAVCILGSATPSLESYANAKAGKYTLLDMPDRVPVAGRQAAVLPEVRVVDLALEYKKHQLHGVLSEPLREAIDARLARREQIILLQNRRGYAPVLECRACGHAPECRDCAVTLTYHKARRQVRCHYCGLTHRAPDACPECGQDELAQLGVGTQMVEEELETIFPDVRMLRMDFDTTSKKGAHGRILNAFGRGEADILVGTQMVAKGLDFPRVTLVGIVSADTGLLMPDFRAEERTFQLLTQVAGRAGRADLPGEVILQTRHPKRPVISLACRHDYIGFAETALEERRAMGYPPFGRVVNIEFRGPAEADVKQLARTWTGELVRIAGPDVQVLGPEAAFIRRVKGFYRYQTMIKLPRHLAGGFIQSRIRTVQQTYRHPPRGCRVAVDIDAVGMS
jgi:primosomal protein N' (replication factor Y) (superfamily II helicase)